METLSTFKKAKAIRESLLTRAGEAMSYSWSNDFKIENLNDIHKSLTRWEEEYGSFKINPQDLSVGEMKELGFGRWSEESEVMLIPIWLLPFLCEEFEITSISGSKYSKLSEIDNDHRFGLLAYGVVPK